jgi:hypothetical protein
MRVPEHITGTWMDSLSDADLLVAESRLHKAYLALETAERKARGGDFELMRGPAELLAAWGRWSRISAFARARGLHARRTPKKTRAVVA